MSEQVGLRGAVTQRWDSIVDGRPAMTESELIAAHGGLPFDRNVAVSVKEMHQRAVAAAIEQAEALLIARRIAPLSPEVVEESA